MYEKIKSWLIDHKKEFYLGAGFLIVFVAGYGTGLGERVDLRNDLKQSDYSTKTQDSKTVGNDKSNPNGQTLNGECKIKGTASKIYHVPGGAFYERVTTPVACFATEAEAQAAGYRKSSR